jgi:hypothetical protein
LAATGCGHFMVATLSKLWARKSPHAPSVLEHVGFEQTTGCGISKESYNMCLYRTIC